MLISRDLALRLDERAADLGKALHEVLGDLGLRGDRVAEEVHAAGADGRLAQSLVAFHQYLGHREDPDSVVWFADRARPARKAATFAGTNFALRPENSSAISASTASGGTTPVAPT